MGESTDPGASFAAVGSSAPPGARLRRLLRPALVGFGVLFMALTGWDLAQRWQPGELHVDVALLLLAFLPLLVGPFVQGFAWLALLTSITGRRPATLPGMVLYLDSQLGRYTPGKVGLPAVRMAGAERLGTTATVVGVSILLEMTSWLVVGATLGLGLLHATNAHAAGVLALLGRYGLPAIGLAVLTLLGLTIVDRERLPSRWRTRLAPDGHGPVLPARLPAYHVLYWGTWAIHGYLVTLAVSGQGSASWAAPGIFLLGSVMAFLAAFAPAGMGVREAAFAVGLAPLIGAAPSLAVAIASRALSVAAELVAWALVRAASRWWSPRRQSRIPDD